MLKALRSRDFTVTSIHNTPSLNIRVAVHWVWKQGMALELARGLRFALDVEVGAAKVASNIGEEHDAPDPGDATVAFVSFQVALANTFYARRHN